MPKVETLQVKLSTGHVVICPEVCISRADLQPTDTLYRTHGFTSYTVVSAEGKVLGWVPREAGAELPGQVS